MVILEILLGVLWVVGGAFAARKAIAQAERHYLAISPTKQNKMDADDWVGAIIWAGLAFVFFPVVAAMWLLSYPARWIYRPIRAFMLPPVQKQFEAHVRALNLQRELVMSTARTYNEVLNWRPEDHPDRVAMLRQLQDVIKEQMEQLMAMCDNTSAHDGDYLQEVKFEVKELTA